MWQYETQNKIHRRHGKMEDMSEAVRRERKRRDTEGQKILSDRGNKIWYQAVMETQTTWMWRGRNKQSKAEVYYIHMCVTICVSLLLVVAGAFYLSNNCSWGKVSFMYALPSNLSSLDVWIWSFNLCKLICISFYLRCIMYMFTIYSAWHLAVWFCLHKMFMFMYPSPGVKRTFPHISICGSEFPGVEQEAGTVLLVAFPGRPSPNRAPLVWAQHLVDGGAVLVSQGGRGCITILLGV